jgi:hypothetical protein
LKFCLGERNLSPNEKVTEKQIVFAPKEYQQGTKVLDICRKLGIAKATFYCWQQQSGSLRGFRLEKLNLHITGISSRERE